MDAPCQKGKMDESQTTSDDPKNPKARNEVLHPEEVPVHQKLMGETLKAYCASLPNLHIPEIQFSSKSIKLFLFSIKNRIKKA